MDRSNERKQMGGWMNGQVEGEKIDGWMDEWMNR